MQDQMLLGKDPKTHTPTHTHAHFQYAFLCAYTDVCMYAFIYTCICIYVNVCIYVFMYLCMHFFMNLCIDACVASMYACMYVCMLLRLFIYGHFFIYLCPNMHLLSLTQSLWRYDWWDARFTPRTFRQCAGSNSKTPQSMGHQRWQMPRQ